MQYTILIQCPLCGRGQKVEIDALKTPRTLQFVAEQVMHAHFDGFHPKQEFNPGDIRVSVAVVE